MKVYGPYTRKDGRKHVIIYENGKTKTVSYPKFLMEQKIGRQLSDDETVDHVDRNFQNDAIENLQILKRSKHSSIDHIRVEKANLICAWCGCEFERRAVDVDHAHRLGKAGPFCSKNCSGQYGAALQNGSVDNFDIQPEIPIDQRTYYFLNKK